MGTLSSKMILMVIASNQFRDEEYQKPRALLEAAGAMVTVASSSLKEATGMLGLEVKPDILLKDAKMEQFDAVVFVGGMGATEYWENPAAHALAKSAYQSGKVTSAGSEVIRGTGHARGSAAHASSANPTMSMSDNVYYVK